MSFVSTIIALVCTCIGGCFYTLWDVAVVLLFIPRAVFELGMLFFALLLAAANKSFLSLSDSADPTVWGVAKHETRVVIGFLRRDLLATLMTPKLLRELSR